MRTPFNDIIPRNMGTNGKIFDPSIDWFTLSAGTTVAGGIAYGVYELGD
jgi:hypothetical protein